MHECMTPVMRKRLADPAACGVRLGVQLRADAEQEAYLSGMCLSHWIKHVVQEALRNSRTQKVKEPNATSSNFVISGVESDVTSPESTFESAYRKEMEEFK
jgi:hypothetical protein